MRWALAPLVALSVACPPPAPRADTGPAPPVEPVNDDVTWTSKSDRRQADRDLRAALKEILPAHGGGRVILTRCEKRPCVVAVYGDAAMGGRDGVMQALRDRGYTIQPKGRAGRAGKGYKWLWVFPAVQAGAGQQTRQGAEDRIPNVWAQAMHILRPGEQ